MNKKAESIGMETLIFTILNVTFFAIMLIFIVKSGNNLSIYEEAYAKQIALIIDNARENTNILMDFSMMDKNSIVTIDSAKQIVNVKLSSEGGYSYKYFTNYNVNVKMKGKDVEMEITGK